MGYKPCDGVWYLMPMVVVLLVLTSIVSEAAAPGPSTSPTTNPTPSSTNTTANSINNNNNATASAYLSGHNAARAKVGVGPLTWSSALAAFAQQQAASVRASDTCSKPAAASRSPYGENKFWGSGKPWTPQEAVSAWVKTGKFYNATTNACLPGPQTCGEYTQVVWRATTQLGCASATCSSNDNTATFIMCSYNPPGNVAGKRPF